MENMTDNKNMGDRMKRSNIYIIRVSKRMEGSKSQRDNNRIFQNDRNHEYTDFRSKTYHKQD